MLHLIFCSLSSLTCGENIFIKVSVVWLVLSGCQVCPILYISGERVCTLQPDLMACQLSTEMCCTNSASEEEINMYPKSQFQPKKRLLNSQIYEVVNCELWLTLRRLESSQCSFLCWLQISIFIVNPLWSYSQTTMWNDCSSVFAGGLSTWQDNLCECKSCTLCSLLFLACALP